MKFKNRMGIDEICKKDGVVLVKTSNGKRLLFKACTPLKQAIKKVKESSCN